MEFKFETEGQKQFLLACVSQVVFTGNYSQITNTKMQLDEIISAIQSAKMGSDVRTLG